MSLTNSVMNTLMNTDTIREQSQAEHLEQVRTLLKAVASAIAAMEKNDLRQLESHLAVQETMCNRLSASAPMLMSVGVGDPSGENTGAPLLQEIRKAYIALANLNRVYAAVLKRARRSVALMSALYRHHVPVTQSHTWSCEV